MKIVVLQDDLPPHHAGGGGVIAYRLAKKLAQRGHMIVAITTVQRREDAGHETVDGIEIYRLYSDYHPRWRAYKSLYNSAVLRDVARLLQDFAPDVVHVHNVHTHLSYHSLALAHRYGRAVVMTEHDAMSFHFGKLPSVTDATLQELPEETYRESFIRQLRMYQWRFNPLRTMLVRYAIRKYVHATVAVSHALGQALQHNGVPVRAVIHNGIDMSQWAKPDRVAEFEDAHGLKGSVICFGGRLSEPKGGLQAVKALSLVRRSVPTAQLLVAGKQDAFAERMQKFADERGIGDALVFAGWLSGDELKRVYYASSIIVTPSLYLDPFPTVNLEALACGKSVVASCFGGSKEVVENNVSGFVVNPQDTDLLADKLTHLLLNKKEAEQFGAAGRERVAHEFTLEKQASEYEQLFVELL